MSWRHGLAAGELQLRDPTAKAVLSALAFHANDFTGQCWPDLERLVLFTGLSKRAVQTAMRRLESADLVKVKPGGGRGYASVYTLALPGIRPLAMSKDKPPAEKGAAAARKGAAAAAKDASAASQSKGNDQQQTLTPGWRPDDETIAWVKQERPGIGNDEIEIEIGRFVSTNLANETEVKNVRHAFRAWVLQGKRLDGQRHARDAARVSAGQPHGRLRAIAGGKGKDRRAEDA